MSTIALYESDEAQALQELRLDPTFPRIDPADYPIYIRTSLRMGQEASRRFAGLAPAEAAALLGARIEKRDEPRVVAGRAVISEYDSGRRLITLWLPEIIALQRAFEQHRACCAPHLPLQQDHAEQAAIAHELFHHLEATGLGSVARALPSVPMVQIGMLRCGRRHVARCSEIAAHAFAKAMTGLPFLPSGPVTLPETHALPM